MNEVLELTPTTPAPVAMLPSNVVTPLQLLQMAVQQGADLDRLERLMAMKKEWEADEARKAYNAAFASFKDESVRIIKNRSVTDGPLKNKKYAELFAVVNAVTPALSKHGLSAAWQITKDDRDWLEVTCTLKHVAGHSERVSMGGPPDAGGAKNAIMARASTVTYLERYTLKAILGLSEQEDDDDGKGGGGTLAGRLAELVAQLRTTTTDKAALDFWNANKAELQPDRKAYEEFKAETAAHRQELKEARA
jgi:hypothetical protein